MSKMNVVSDLCNLGVRALRRMYLPEPGIFAFRLGRRNGQDYLEGVSYRYTAIVLLALAETGDQDIFPAGVGLHEVCDRLVRHVDHTDDVGEVALTLWAARALGHAGASHAAARLRAMNPVQSSFPTVELSWCLTAQVVPGGEGGDLKLAADLATRLTASQRESGLFSHWPIDATGSALRGHVCCFADKVYPVQALSYYSMATGDAQALEAARRCGKMMRDLQGPAGQWWWHFDVRTGKVVEKYPVYAVHQDAMGPMALLALRQAGGEDSSNAITRSLQWLLDAPELGGSLWDRSFDVIWRKVARREPNKLSRQLQAVTSRLHPALRFPAVDFLFPPGKIDYETRPYHMGWMLYAFSGARAAQLNWD